MEIELCGYRVFIDDEDRGKIDGYNWSSVSKNGNVYFCTTIKRNRLKTTYILHRVIMNLIKGDGLCVDHKNGNTFDNRKSNLRICTKAENNRNQKINKLNTTGYKGVCYENKRNKYKAQITYFGKRINLGYYNDPAHAYLAYCEASKKYHREFGRTE